MQGSKTASFTILTLVIAIAMTALGGILLYQYYAAPAYDSAMKYGTVQVGWANGTDSLKVNSFTIGASLTKGYLVVSFSTFAFKPGVDTFYVVLPVQVSSLQADGNQWKYYNVPGYGSLLVARVLSNRTQNVWAEITTGDALVSGSRG